jgi:uncharacterized LabA/DUF88 family protein
MARISIFVDGFNLYHSIDDHRHYHKYKWLNLDKLGKCFVGSKDSIVDIFYFTTYVTWDQQKLIKHQNYVRALQLVNVKPIFGAFRKSDRKCKICGKEYKSFEEKQTDVNIAVKLFETATLGTWDKALIISGDSDLIPAIEAVKKTFPVKEIGIIIPIGRRAEELKAVANFYMRIKEKHLRACQFENEIIVDQNQKLVRPVSWN